MLRGGFKSVVGHPESQSLLFQVIVGTQQILNIARSLVVSIPSFSGHCWDGGRIMRVWTKKVSIPSFSGHCWDGSPAQDGLEPGRGGSQSLLFQVIVGTKKFSTI